MSTPEGWGFPLASEKAHYFIDSRSLCGKWAYIDKLEQENDESSGNCTACKKALVKLREKRQVELYMKALEKDGKVVLNAMTYHIPEQKIESLDVEKHNPDGGRK